MHYKVKFLLRKLGINSLVWKLKRFLDLNHGAIVEQLVWKSMSKNWATGTLSEESLSLPFRSFILEQLQSQDSFSSVLEIGCAAGANLVVLSKEFEDVSFTGVDINKRAIRVGKEFLHELGRENVELQACTIANVPNIFKQQFDIVLVSAVFLHIAPDKVREALNAALAVCKRRLLLIELHDGQVELYRYDSRWIYNWHALLAGHSFTIDRVPASMAGEPWSISGHVIWVDLPKN